MGHLPYARLQRLTQYLFYLRSLPSDSQRISAPMIADAMDYTDVLVRKDLAVIGRGRNKIGRNRKELIAQLEDYLGLQAPVPALFLTDRSCSGELGLWDNFVRVLCRVNVGDDMPQQTDLQQICRDRNIRLGILDVSPNHHRQACDTAVSAGIRIIWNISPVPIYPPENVTVYNEVLNSSLIRISHQLQWETQHTPCQNSKTGYNRSKIRQRLHVRNGHSGQA